MDITAIFFSCRRLQLLQKTIDGFLRFNTYPIEKMIIVNDSGDEFIHNVLKTMYPGFTLVLNGKNVGLMKSIDIGYGYVKTDYLFHCEDDWMVTKSGFMEQSLEIMNNEPLIEEVWLADYNNYPLDEEIKDINGVKYRLAKEGHENWYGFTTACGLKRKSDYVKVGPYSWIERGETIWHHERNIGLKYHELGYRTAALMDEYAINIGIGKSEYITGHEN